MWVWQNYMKWTNVPGSEFAISEIPEGATKMDVYGWDGLRKSVPLTGQKSVTMPDLQPNETYMFVSSSNVSKP